MTEAAEAAEAYDALFDLVGVSNDDFASQISDDSGHVWATKSGDGAAQDDHAEERAMSAGERQCLYNTRMDELRHPLLALAAAQRTTPYRARHFLAASDIADLKRVVEGACAPPLSRSASGVSRLGRAGERPVASANWTTRFLHAGGMFHRHCGDLCRRIADLARRADTEQGWGLLADKTFGGSLAPVAAGAGACACTQERVCIRCVEYHDYTESGALKHRKHYDRGSLITVGIMLSHTKDFEGGAFQTLEADGTMRQHAYEQGDALVFVSHKYHGVAPVTAGRRTVLITEFWRGPERHCGHRCTELSQLPCTSTQQPQQPQQSQPQPRAVDVHV